MKKRFLKRVTTLLAPAALTVAMMAFSPAAAFAADHGGYGGRGGGNDRGHSYSERGRGDFRGGRSYDSGRGYNGGGGYNGGRAYGGRGYDRDYRRGYEGGRYYGGRGYYRPGFGFGIYAAPYGYAAPVCSPAGFYDQGGYWHYYAGCVPPPPYGY